MSRVATLALLVASGCLDKLGPDVGEQLFSACSDEDSDPSVDVSFETDLRTGVMMRCARCHTPGGQMPIGLQIGGLDVSSYATLRAGGVHGGAMLVVPEAPCDSILVKKLGPAPPFGERMPEDGPYLTTVEAQLVVDWIAEGAHDN